MRTRISLELEIDFLNSSGKNSRDREFSRVSLLHHIVLLTTVLWWKGRKWIILIKTPCCRVDEKPIWTESVHLCHASTLPWGGAFNASSQGRVDARQIVINRLPLLFLSNCYTWGKKFTLVKMQMCVSVMNNHDHHVDFARKERLAHHQFIMNDSRFTQPSTLFLHQPFASS